MTDDPRQLEPVPCDDCGADRVRRWEATRAKNGLTEDEWPRPTAPLFKSPEALAEHRRRQHAAGD